MKTAILAILTLFLAVAIFAAPVLAQVPPAPTNVSATATSNSSMTITWTVIPSSGCSGAVDYYVRAISALGHRVDNFTAINASSQSFAGLVVGSTYAVDVYAYCWGNDEYSSAATTSVTISTSSQPVPTVAPDSLGTVPPKNLSATASGGIVTATWTNAIGQTAPTGYCDVTDYSVKLAASDGSQADYDDYIVAGTWTSIAVATGANYEVRVTAYSAECDDWSAWASYTVYVS